MMSSTVMHEPYLHFTHGDPLWFAAWAPRTRGAMGAVCITLVLLAVLQRLFASARGVLETEWRKQAPHVASEHKMRLFSLPMAEKRDDAIPPPTPTTAVHVTLQHYSLLRTPPFILAHDLGRGLAFACEAAVSFLILLAVWTHNAAFVISIILGLGVGHALFGRLISPVRATMLF